MARRQKKQDDSIIYSVIAMVTTGRKLKMLSEFE